jgi:hypothetical protein
MYHIFAAKCHRQDSARLGEYHPLGTAAADAPCLVHALAPVLACVGGVDEEVDLAGPGGGLDPLGAGDQRAGTRLQAEPVERILTQRSLGPLADIGRDGDGVALERPLQRGLELAFGMGLVELGAPDADPRAAARRARPHVGRDASVRPEREPSNRPEDKGGILAEYGLSEEQGNEIIMAARAHWFEDEEPAQTEEAADAEPSE